MKTSTLGLALAILVLLMLVIGVIRSIISLAFGLITFIIVISLAVFCYRKLKHK